jgi:hypothetical protein
MKTISKIGFVASLCALGLSSTAQINEFNHINGFPADHGQGDKVITTMVSEVNPVASYVTAGRSLSTSVGEMPTVALAKYDLAGMNLWHKTFIVNSPKAANSLVVKGLAEASNPANSGYGVLVFTNASPQQSVLIKTDAAGNFMWKQELGHEQAASLSYDNDLDRFLVLTRSLSGFAADLQLISIDAKTGAILFTRNYDGFNKSNDEPASILYDSFHKAYLISGTATVKSIIGTQTQLMLVRTSNTGALVYTRLIGYFGVTQVAVDAALMPSGLTSMIAIGGRITGVLASKLYTNQPSYTTVDVATGNVADVSVIRSTFDFRGIAFIPSASSLTVIGNRPVLFGTQADLFSIDPTDPSMIGSLHQYNNPFTTYAFNNIANGDVDQLVMVGQHLLPLPWAGSPAGLTYQWLTTADSYGNGKCDNSGDTASVFVFPVPVMSNNASSVSFIKGGVSIEEIAQSESMLDACDIPFRLTNNQSATAEFRVYPNPATSSVTVEYTIADNDNADLTLIDMSGRVVLSQKLVSGDHATTTLNVAELASGLYYSDLRVNGLSVKKDKLVVQH